MEKWTIEKLLGWMTGYFTEKGIDSPRLSAEMLLSHVLSMKRIELYMHFGKVIEPQTLAELRQLVKRAGQHEPVAYLVGKTEFYSLQIQVSRDCLIPRPETEVLVENAIEFIRARKSDRRQVCDLCTGSGCIALAIAKNVTNIEVIATDKSESALKVAAENLAKYNLTDRVKLFYGDLFDPLTAQLNEPKFDLITCNPPYVTAAEYQNLAKNIKDYEPKSALVAGENGLEVYRRIFERADDFLKLDGCLMLEIGCNQAQAVSQLAQQTGTFTEITVKKDLNKNDRLIIAKKN